MHPKALHRILTDMLECQGDLILPGANVLFPTSIRIVSGHTFDRLVAIKKPVILLTLDKVLVVSQTPAFQSMLIHPRDSRVSFEQVDPV